MACKRIRGGLLLEQDDYKPGDPAPEGYLAWHEWAEVQHKARLRQKQCGRCGLWRYPQELSDQIDRVEMQSRKGPVMLVTAVCLKCVRPNSNMTGLAPAQGDQE
jgi:hypothetical protein